MGDVGQLRAQRVLSRLRTVTSETSKAAARSLMRIAPFAATCSRILALRCAANNFPPRVFKIQASAKLRDILHFN